MGLRERLTQSLRPELHVATPRACNMQLSAVALQPSVQPACNDAGVFIGETGATGAATGVQLSSCISPKNVLPERNSSCTAVRPFRLSAADADSCHAGGWDDAEIAAFVARHARLMAHGLTDGSADDLAERLTLRDREGDDWRVCIECAHFRGRRCRQPERAGVGGPEVGALALTLQHCPAFGPADGER